MAEQCRPCFTVVNCTAEWSRINDVFGLFIVHVGFAGHSVSGRTEQTTEPNHTVEDVKRWFQETRSFYCIESLQLEFNIRVAAVTPSNYNWLKLPYNICKKKKKCFVGKKDYCNN